MKLLLENVFFGIFVSALFCVTMLLATDLNVIFIPVLIITAAIWCVFRVRIKKPLMSVVINLVGGFITLWVMWLPSVQNWGSIVSVPCTCIAILIFTIDLIVYLLDSTNSRKGVL